jgi:hypothetical protein
MLISQMWCILLHIGDGSVVPEVWRSARSQLRIQLRSANVVSVVDASPRSTFALPQWSLAPLKGGGMNIRCRTVQTLRLPSTALVATLLVSVGGRQRD